MGVSASRARALLCTVLVTGMVCHLYSRFGRPAVNLRQLLALSIRVAEEGGRALGEVQSSGSLGPRSQGNKLRTDAELLSHSRMTSLFGNAYPQIKYEIPTLIQESIRNARIVSPERITVWIDPLDATQEFTDDLRHLVTTMVCVAVDGKPVIGVIHKPFSKYTAWAMVNGTLNIHPRKSYNEKTPNNNCLQIPCRSSGTYSKTAFGNDAIIIPAGGAGYKVLSLLNAGEHKQPDLADLYIHVTFIKKWDICAGNAILKALGGQMTTIEGDTIDYSDSPSNKVGVGLVATIGMDHYALLERLSSLKSLALKK
ncbi:inositol monophosphatase 3-like [Pristis pectinata]|uniref:inositol monophosphatase 3-like n=1 Tax=Pristis pectinata TaxID=685728 RepID=UPI00223DF155|nr:inositol monophosphatase 3-like [Pristis pectinata]